MNAEVLTYDADQIRDALRKMVTPQRPVLTTAEAASFVGISSERTFRRWRRKWRVRECGKGRFPVRALTAAMEREARSA